MKRRAKSLSALKLAAATASLAVLMSCGSGDIAPSDVAARVNGVDITSARLEEEYRQNVRGLDPAPDADEASRMKLELLNDIVTNEIMLQLASERELTATDAEVEEQFDEYKAQYAAERFEELLAEQGMTADDVREDLRISLTIEKLVNMEVTSRISVSDSDIADFFERNMASFDYPESFFIAHILITPVEDTDINNLEGDDATTLEEARDKAASLLGQIQDGQDFGMMARRYSEDPSSVPTNGELGFQPIASITGVDPRLAEAVLEMEVGEVYPDPVETPLGFHLVKLIDRDEGGQKDLSDPRVESNIRQIIRSRRDQLLRGAFYETARNEADVENFFAERVLGR